MLAKSNWSGWCQVCRSTTKWEHTPKNEYTQEHLTCMNCRMPTAVNDLIGIKRGR